jgi:glycosyltransferase involved in cell wall biosynthesis
LNILILAQYFPPDLGGAATRAYNIAKGLSLNGCNVTVITAAPHYPHGNIPSEYRWRPLKLEYISGIKVIRTFMPSIKSVGFLKRLLLRFTFAISSLFAFPFIGKIDLIWASSWASGYIYSKVKRKPLALNVDDLTLDDLVDLEILDKNSVILKIGELLYKVFLSKGDIITPISPGYEDLLVKKYYVKAGRIYLIRGGVDLTVFKESLPKAKSDGKFTVAYSGAFSVAYDFDQIFKAAKIIHELDRNIQFIIQGNGELLDSMHSTIRELGIDNVCIIDKLLSRDGVNRLLHEADVLILPLAKFNKPYRGFSSKLYEYQAVAKPIICCSLGIPKEYVQETQCGLVVCPGDYKTLVKSIFELKNNPHVACLMGMNGRRFVEENASLNAIGLKMRGILEELEMSKVERCR